MPPSDASNQQSWNGLMIWRNCTSLASNLGVTSNTTIMQNVPSIELCLFLLVLLMIHRYASRSIFYRCIPWAARGGSKDHQVLWSYWRRSLMAWTNNDAPTMSTAALLSHCYGSQSKWLMTIRSNKPWHFIFCCCVSKIQNMRRQSSLIVASMIMMAG